jgi:hypothetical protein
MRLKSSMFFLSTFLGKTSGTQSCGVHRAMDKMRTLGVVFLMSVVLFTGTGGASAQQNSTDSMIGLRLAALSQDQNQRPRNFTRAPRVADFRCGPTAWCRMDRGNCCNNGSQYWCCHNQCAYPFGCRN